MPETSSKIRPYPGKSPATERDAVPRASRSQRPYVELQVTSNFTFLTGASHPDELVQQAAELGHHAAAITDVNSLAGIVRAHVAAKEIGIPLAVGCRLVMQTGRDGDASASRDRNGAMSRSESELLVYPSDRAAYARLCRLLTLGKRRAPKGECHLTLHDVLEYHEGLLAIVVPPAVLDQSFIEVLHGLKRSFDDDRLSLASSCLYGPDDRGRLRQLADLAEHVNVPLVATNDVHYHIPERRALQDVLTCIRHGCTIDRAGWRLFPHAERYLKSPAEMARLFAAYPQALSRTVQIARRAAQFSLDELRYEYPDEVVPSGKTAMQHLMDLTWAGAVERYAGTEGLRNQSHGRGAIGRSDSDVAPPLDPSVPQSLSPFIPPHVIKQICHEFRLIDELNYAPYFLTVHDLVVYARSRGILCQGRGAAANSAVCYCLGVTAVDPDRINVLFERFISKERNEPPDIDIDFEHERREEVIQYIYNKYGRDRAALTAEVITYRGRSAVRDVGKALGLSLEDVDRLAKGIDWWESGTISMDRLRELGFEPDARMLSVIALTYELLGFPRHLSQHVGGFVITRGRLDTMVPVENAAMENRTVIEWDKDDIDSMNMLKVDVLGLGMLTVIQKCFTLVNEKYRVTEFRSDEVTKYPDNEGGTHGRDQDVSRHCGLAEGHDPGGDGVSRNPHDAQGGAIRVNQSDEAVGSVRAIEHCRGIRSREGCGLPEVSQDCPRLVERIGNPIRTGAAPEYAAEERSSHRDDRGGRSHPPRLYQQHPQPQQLKTNATSSLRHSATPSLPLQLHTIPPEDPTVYDMICRADTVGVFQIESRAQMSMLPRLRPRCFYDLVIEVAIVRPGPIQGDMVHPYLRRRNGEEPIHYPDERVRRVLERTLGVPLFQEQAMSLAVAAAGFTPGEADQLRRAIAAWKQKSHVLASFGERIINGMIANGYNRTFAEQCFTQIKGFSGYGFPESHAASFALLVYVSAWLKCHHPDAFAAALINSQPMGFYQPAQIVRDAQEHGVQVLPVDVNHSGWDCRLEREGAEGPREKGPKGGSSRDLQSPSGPQSLSPSVPQSLSPCLSFHPLRLGMRLVRGMREDDARAIAAAVAKHGRFGSIHALHRASGVRVSSLRRLASAGAFASMGLDRQAALWQVRKLRDEPLPMFDDLDDATLQRVQEEEDAQVNLPPVPELRNVTRDYATVGLTLRSHPMSFIRSRLDESGVTLNGTLRDEAAMPHGTSVAVAGLVLVRQRPSTASGIVFMTIEDETGIANLIIRPKVYERYRQAARSGVVLVRGRVERQGEVIHINTRSIEPLQLDEEHFRSRSRDFH